MTETVTDRALLEELLSKAGESDEASADFFAHLVESDLFILNGDAAMLEDESDLNLLQWEAEDGMFFIPVFTSLEELIRSTGDEKSPCSTMNAGALFDVVMGTDVVVNPMSEYSFHIDPEEMELLLAGFGERDLIVPVPTTDIEQLKEKLTAHLLKEANVLKAVIVALADADSREEHTILVGVEFAHPDMIGDLFEKSIEAMMPFIPEGLGLDFVAVAHDADPEGIDGFLLKDGLTLFSKQ